MKKIIYILIVVFNTLCFTSKSQVISWSKNADTIINNIDDLTYSYIRDFKSAIIKKTKTNEIIHLNYIHKITSFNLYTSSTFDSFIVTKFGMSGNKIWSQKFSLYPSGIIDDIIETNDKGFMLIGEIGNNNSIIKIDSNGTLVFIKNNLNTDSLLKYEKIVATNDGNFIIASYKEKVNEINFCDFFTYFNTSYKTFISKIDAEGNIIWNKSIDSSTLLKPIQNDYLLSQTDYYHNFLKTNIDLLPDNTLNIIKVFNQNENDDKYQIVLYHLNDTGLIIEQKTIKQVTNFGQNGLFNDCIDGLNIPFKITANGYILYNYDYPNCYLKNYFTKEGILYDSICVNLSANEITQESFNSENVYSVDHSSSTFINNNYYFIANNRFSDISSLVYYKTDTDYIYQPSKNVTLNDENNYYNFVTPVDDSTLLVVSHALKNKTDSTAILKFYRISINLNQIDYSIYIDRNHNGIKDVSDTAFSDCFIELNNGTTTIDLQPSEGDYTKYLFAGNYTSKLISYNQTLKHYNVEPVSKNTIFTSDTRGIDTIIFRLTPKPNIQDLQVSIVPTIGARPGFSSSYKLIAKNVGTKIMYLPTVKFIKDSLQTFTDSTTYALVADTLFWEIDSLSLLEQREIVVSVLNAIPPTLNANDTLHLSAQIFPMENDSFSQDNYASLNQVVRNSVDPNDKIETHGGTIPYSAVQNRDYLYYTIRFQNTGNSYATRIVITDTLTENVDASTFEFLSSSVPFVMNVVDRKHITWTAANTYLPDSIADEPNSHGYISFRIKPKAGLLPSDEITNRASIVFDYNAAILTNTCTTNIIEQRILSVKNNEIKSIHLFPNPTNGNVQLNMNLLQNKNYTLRIIDINGNLLSNENLKGNAGENNVSIELSTYANGLYFIQVSDETGNLFYGKVVKQ